MRRSEPSSSRTSHLFPTLSICRGLLRMFVEGSVVVSQRVWVTGSFPFWASRECSVTGSEHFCFDHVYSFLLLKCFALVYERFCLSTPSTCSLTENLSGCAHTKFCVFAKSALVNSVLFLSCCVSDSRRFPSSEQSGCVPLSPRQQDHREGAQQCQLCFSSLIAGQGHRTCSHKSGCLFLHR